MMNSTFSLALRRPLVAAVTALSFGLALPANAQVSFGSSGLAGESSNNPTTLMFGPDNRLYVGQKNGTIYAYNIERVAANDYDVTNTEQINEVKDGVPNHNDDGTATSTSNRQVTGIYVTGSLSNPVLYVSSSDSRIGAGGGGNDLGLDTNSGVISKLTCTGGMDGNNQCQQWDKVDLIRGLPRSEENHATNGMQLDTGNNTLLIAQGGHANAGSPSNNFAFTTEYALSAALLVADLNVIEALPTQIDSEGVAYKYNLPTLKNVSKSELLANDNDHPAPWGGDDGLNQAMLDPNGPVQIYAGGFRNLYDVVMTQSGRIYGVDNGANGGWGGLPEYEESYDCTNRLLPGEPGSTADGPDPAGYPGSVTLHDGLNGTVQSDGQPDSKVNNKNGLHLITQGYYGGHPTPIRGNPDGAGLWYNGTFYEPGNPNLPASWPPVTQPNPVECDFQNSGVDDGALANFGPSTNGITEYTASNFGGALQGVLYAAGFGGAIYEIQLNAAGTVATNCPSNPVNNCNDARFSGFGSQPLDVVAIGDDGLFPGTVWAATYGADNITIFEPADFAGENPNVCLGTDDVMLDEDNDGFDNADEIDNGTDPCSGGSKPTDRDGDLVSDLNDSDDDNDGLNDNDDHFQLDAANGTATSLPVIRELFSDVPAPVSFFGMGFSGIMANGDDYLTLIDDVDVASGGTRQLIAGGTAGLFTDTEIGEGDAFAAVNSQKNAFQFGIDVDSGTTPFTVRARVLGPFLGETPDDFASQGIYVGTGDQDDYVKLVVNANAGGNGGFQLGIETAGTFSSAGTAPSVPGVLTEVYVDLYLSVDPATGDITGAYRLESDPTNLVTIGTKTASGDLLAAIQGTYTVGGSPSALAVGTIATSTGPTDTFNGTWDFIYVTEDTAAQLAVTPASLDFGTVNTGTSGVLNLSLSHSGGALSGPVTVSAANLVGANSSEFSSDFVGPLVLNPGDSADVQVSFSPLTAAAGKTAAIEFVHDGANASPQSVSLIGDGTDTPPFVECVNAGGPGYTSTSSGLVFAADSATYFDNGTVFTKVDAIDGTTDDTLFHTERYAANLSYSIPVPSAGDYDVVLYFAELYFGAPGGGSGGGVGSRVFDIIIEGATVDANYDIFAEVGALTAVTKTYSTTTPDSELNISFPASVNNGKLSAVCVYGAGGGGNLPPVVQPIADQSSFEGDDIGNAGLFVNATDQEPLAYSATGLPPGVLLEPTNGQILGTISAGAAAGSPYAVTVSVDDGTNSPVTASFSWTVSEAPAISVSIVSPQDGAVLTTNDPTLTWSTTGLPGDQGDHLHLYVDTLNFDLRISPLPLSGSAPLSFYTGGRLLADGPHTIVMRPADTGHTEYPGIETRVDFSVSAGSIVTTRINAGGPQLAAADGSGPAWSEDTGGAASPTKSPFLVAGSNYGISTHVVPVDLSDPSIAGGPAAVEALFQKERWDNLTAPEMKWELPVTPGATVELRLYFAETFDTTQVVGERVFDVSVEGTVPAVYDDIDLFALTGADKAIMLPYQITTSDGTLDVEFLHGVENPAVKAIEVIELQAGAITNPAALIQVLPGAGLGASTFTGGSIQVANTGDQNITSVAIDLSSAILQDVVFDPNGTAGDNAAKCFEANSVGSTGYVVPADNCVDPFSGLHNGTDTSDGYDVVSISFTDFNPGESFTASVDIDPTSIKTDVTAGDAGSVSGLELAGSTVTVTFGDGSTLITTLFEEGSLGGANAVAAKAAPVAPAIAMAGVSAPALVADANQTLDISGPPNATVTVLQLDGHLYIDAGQTNPGYDIDPFEANSAVAKTLYTTTLDGSGNAQLPVTLLQTAVGGAGPDGGINHFLAVVEGAGQQNSVTSNRLVVEYDPASGANLPPLVTSPGDQTSAEGDIVSLAVVASAPEAGQVLSFAASDLPPGLSIDPASGVIAGTIDDGSSGGGAGAFIEAGGIVVIEMESVDNRPANWVLGPDENPTSPNINDPGGATGGQFLVWEAGQSLGTPGNGLMTYPVQINTPGTYQFKWRNQVGNGTNTTEHNDTWLKIEANSFYGQQGGGSIVCPKGFNPAVNDCTGGAPEGSGSNGWFKVYSSGANNWSWVSNTSDNDAHQIYARFDAPGVYNVLVSARSSSHVIDRMVLAKDDYSGNEQSLALPESARAGGSGPGASANSPYAVSVVVTDDGVPAAQTTVNFSWTVFDPAGGDAQLAGVFDIPLRSAQGGAGLALPLTVNVYGVGDPTPSYSFAPVADGNGNFTVGGIAPGTWEVAVKHANTLQVVATLGLVPGSNSADFGVLPVGDVNDDNVVSIADLSTIVPTFDTASGQPGFDARADLDGDGVVSISDLSAIVPNFDVAGEVPSGVTPP